MRIVAARTRHGFAALSFAFALQQGFSLSDRTQILGWPASQHVVADIVRKQLSWAKVISMPPGPLDGDVPLKVTFHAD